MAGVHAPVEVALDNALLHELERGDMRVVDGTRLGRNLRPPVVTVVVVHGCVLAEPLLQGGDDELRLVGVVAVGIGLRLQPLAQACAIGGVCPLQVSGMLVDHHTHVRCTLDVGLAAQGVHAAAGDADVAKQQLHHGHGSRVLGAIGVLGLAERVEHGAGLTGLGGRGIGFVDEFENILVHTADTANGVERVTGIVLLELLVDAHGVLQRHVLLGVGERRRGELRGAGLLNPGVCAVLAGVPVLGGLGLVMPAVGVVRLGLLVPTAEQARLGIELVVGIKDVGSVGVVEQVLEVVLAHVAGFLVLGQVRLDEVLDDVVVHASVERDVGAGTDGAPDIGLLSRTGVARIDDDPLSALLMGLLKPQRAYGVVLNGVGTAIQDDVGVLEVAPMARHGATTE